MKFGAFVAATAMVGSFVCGSANAATLLFKVTVDARDETHYEVKNGVTKVDTSKTTHPSMTFDVTIETDDLFTVGHSSYSDPNSAAWRSEINPTPLSATALPYEAELVTLAGGTLGAVQGASYFKASDDYYLDYYTSDPIAHRADNAGLDWGRYRSNYAYDGTVESDDNGGSYFSFSFDSLASLPAYAPRDFTPAELLELFEGKTFSFAAAAYSNSFLVTDGFTNFQKSAFLSYSGVAKLVSVEVAAAAVPEPATWALMIGGFGLAGAALRRRKLAA